MKKKFTRSYDSLEKIFEFAEDVFSSQNVAQSVRFPVHFVMEELFTNMVKYGTGNSNDILLNVDTADGIVEVSLTDYDVDEFDVTGERNVDIDAPLAERTPGGLGVHLIQRMVDTLEYDYTRRRSTVTFTKGPE